MTLAHHRFAALAGCSHFAQGIGGGRQSDGTPFDAQTALFISRIAALINRERSNSARRRAHYE